VNLARLAGFAAGSEVTPETLVNAGIIRKSGALIKVLATGDIKVALTVRAHKFSAVARQKIEAAGGKAEEVAS